MDLDKNEKEQEQEQDKSIWLSYYIPLFWCLGFFIVYALLIGL